MNCSYLRCAVEVLHCVFQVPIMFSVSRVVQLTPVLSVVVCFSFKIKTDTVWFVIAAQLTGVHVRDSEGFYLVFHQTFASEVIKRWERHFTTFA